MKKIFHLLFVSFSLSLLLGCSFAIPKKISVKTGAEFNYCIGNLEEDFSEYFSKDVIADQSAEFIDGTKIYDYYPGSSGGKVQKYLLKIPVQEIGVDFTQYFNETDLAASITGLSFEQKINIPNVDLDEDIKIDSSVLFKAINSIITAGGRSQSGRQPIFFEGNFSSIEYSDAVMIVTCRPLDITGSVSLMYNDEVISTGVFFNGSAVLELKNKTIYKTGMTLNFNGDITSYTVSMAPVSMIKKINTLTIPVPISVPVYSEISNNDSDLMECSITKGSLKADLIIPETWVGATVEYDIGLSGGLIGSVDKSPEKMKTLDLSGKSIGQSSIYVQSNVDFTLKNATIDFTNEAEIKVTTSVDEYASITVLLDSVESTSINRRQNISKEMRDIVEKLDIASSGLVGSYVNTLPEGNDITLLASSSFIDLSKSEILYSNTSAETPINMKSDIETKVITFKDYTNTSANEYNAIDFMVNVQLPGSTAQNQNQLQIRNVIPGNEYEIKLNLQPAVNWNSITLKSQGARQRGSITTGLNVSQMFTTFASVMGGDFSGRIELKKLPVAIYAVRPDLDSFQNAKFVGKLKMFYGIEDENGYIVSDPRFEEQALNFLDSNQNENEALKTMRFVESPEMTFKDDVLVTDIDFNTASANGDLAPLINVAREETEGCLWVDYDLSFINENVSGDTFTINYVDYLNSHSTASSIAIYAMIEIPLEFTTAGDISLNLSEMVGLISGEGEDLFGREEPPTNNQLDDYTDGLRKLSLFYEGSELPFYGTPVILEIDWDGSQNNKYKTTEFSIDKGELDILSLSKIYEIWPLAPEIHAKLQEGDFSIPRQMKLKTKISLQMQMDPDFEYVLWEGGNK